MRGAAEALRERPVGQDAGERLRQRIGVLGIDEETLLAVVDQVEDAAGAARDHTATAREGLDHDPAQALVAGRQD